MAIPVDRLRQVTAARCTSCMSCVDACPSGRSSLHWGPPARLGRRWSQAALVAILLGSTTGAVAAAVLFPLPSFVKTNTVAAPAETATARLKVTDLTCRGRANLLFWFIERDDLYALPGYVKLEAWPGPGAADVHVSYDTAKTNEQAVKQAITEPYFDLIEERWRESPFAVEGYDPLGLGP